MDYNAEKVKDAIHLRVLKYMSAHPGVSFDAGLKHVVSQLDRTIVEHYDRQKGECLLYDPKTGRRGTSPCEPTGRKGFSEASEATEGIRAGDEVASRVATYQADHKMASYTDALATVLKEDETLARAYRVGPGNFYYGDEN